MNKIIKHIKIPLSEPIPGLPKLIYPKFNSANAETKITSLSNNIKVASQTRFGQYSIAGVAIQSGSRYETKHSSGVGHFIERSAFNLVQKEKIAQAGGAVDCQGSRDTLIYAVSVVTQHLPIAVELLNESVLRHKFTDEEVNNTAQRIKFEIEDNARDPERKTQLSEMIHSAAYNNNTLGLPKVCPEENVLKIRPDIIHDYLKRYHTPKRMVLAGVGVDHDELVELAKKYFVDKQAAWLTEPDLSQQLETPKSKYTGGCVAINADLSNVSLGPTPLPNLAHFILGFEVCSHQDLDEFVIVCVMNMLLGGGGSFSAGGPGKGMFTRLFTHVLNRYYWMNSCSAHNASYDDSGIFYIQSSAEPRYLKEMVDIVIRQYLNVAYGTIEAEELARARKQLISMLLLNLEVRPVVFEDIARQVLSTGMRRHPRQLIDKITKVTGEDINRIAQKMLTKNPSIACLGDLSRFPSVDYIKSQLCSKSN